MPTRSARPVGGQVAARDPLAAPRARAPATQAATTAGATHRRGPCGHDGPGQRGGRRRQQRRQPEDAGDACQLRDRQHRHLAVAEQHPGKSAEDGQPAVLGRHPHRRCQPDPRAAVAGDEQVQGEREQARETARGRRPAGRQWRPPAERRCRQTAPSRRWSSTPCRQSRSARSAGPAGRRGARAPAADAGAGRHRDDQRRQRHPRRTPDARSAGS